MKRLMFTKEVLDHCLRVNEAERQFAIIAPRLSWGMLAGLEPKLADLLHDARAADSHHATESFCRESYWYRELKPVLVQIVGYGRPDCHPILGTSAAYGLAYDALLKVLPRCRNCPCCGE